MRALSIIEGAPWVFTPSPPRGWGRAGMTLDFVYLISSSPFNTYKLVNSQNQVDTNLWLPVNWLDFSDPISLTHIRFEARWDIHDTTFFSPFPSLFHLLILGLHVVELGLIPIHRSIVLLVYLSLLLGLILVFLFPHSSALTLGLCLVRLVPRRKKHENN